MPGSDAQEGKALVELKLMVSEDIYRAFQRCLWIRINESGQSQLELMEEVVKNFLMKHGC
ncbi:MAG: hypothetical protein PHI97_14350 [Desulfobulbus sp.]|nr:hypothetical protein [Desulfobulbus sp.]